MTTNTTEIGKHYKDEKTGEVLQILEEMPRYAPNRSLVKFESGYIVKVIQAQKENSEDEMQVGQKYWIPNWFITQYFIEGR